MSTILDYSAGYPGAAAIRAAGHAGVIRYLRKEGGSWVRPITAAELADMRAHGLAVALIYQTTSVERILQGYDAGAHDARWALGQCAAIGLPDAEVPAVYFAADQDIDRAELPRVLAYLDGAAAVLGRHRVGIYGEASVVDAAVPAHAAYGWQTAAWSAGARAARAHLFQRIGQITVGGIRADVNDVLAADFGQLDKEDTVNLNDRIISTDGRPVTVAQAIGAAPWASLLLERLTPRIAAVEAAVLASRDLSPEEFAAAVDAAVARHTPTAEQNAAAVAGAVTAHIGVAVHDAVAEALDGDNAALAETISTSVLAKVAAKLTAGAVA